MRLFSAQARRILVITTFCCAIFVCIAYADAQTTCLPKDWKCWKQKYQQAQLELVKCTGAKQAYQQANQQFLYFCLNGTRSRVSVRRPQIGNESNALRIPRMAPPSNRPTPSVNGAPTVAKNLLKRIVTQQRRVRRSLTRLRNLLKIQAQIDRTQYELSRLQFLLSLAKKRANTRKTTQKRVVPTLAQPTAARILSVVSGNQTVKSFRKAKKLLYSKIYTKNWRTTIYCGCTYTQKNGKRKPNWSSCGFKPRKNKARASRIEMEHVVPASAFCNKKKYNKSNPKCNDQGCRKCSGRLDKQFALMEADMYNLYPAIGEVNGDRSNYPPALLSGEPRLYGKCDVEIDRKKRKFEPSPSVRGDVARGYFYMAMVYPKRFKISARLRTLLEKWDRNDPVTKRECQRGQAIQKIQGNSNPILDTRCRAHLARRASVHGITNSHLRTGCQRGCFQTTKRCPAYHSKNKKTNPGRLYTKSPAIYKVVAQNKPNHPTYYQILIKGKRRWVSVTCGKYTKNGKPIPSDPQGPEGPSPANQKHNNLLALSWQPAFCQTHQNKKECKSQTSTRYDATHFSLHGLWPQPRSNIYCGTGRRYRTASRGSLPEIQLSQAIRSQLGKYMPGMQSGLHLHEWYKHGTCYHTDPNVYYHDSIAMLKQFNASKVRDLFASHIGKQLKASQIREAFNSSFGAGAGRKVQIKCKGRLFTELWVNLKGEFKAGTSLTALIQQAPDARSRCRKGIVDPVGY